MFVRCVLSSGGEGLSEPDQTGTSDTDSKSSVRIPSLIDDYVSDFVQERSANGVSRKEIAAATSTVPDEPDLPKEETKNKKEVCILFQDLCLFKLILGLLVPISAKYFLPDRVYKYLLWVEISWLSLRPQIVKLLMNNCII